MGVKEYKKESLAASSSTAGKAARRLNLVELKMVPAGSHLVFAPMPVAAPSLQCAVNTLSQLRQSTGSDRPAVLFLSDWSARVLNNCNADQKAIAAYYDVLIASLKALDAPLMENVQIVFQSEAILADSSNYWISVINTGRHFMLNDVMRSSMRDSEGVGAVIARLMRVADVAGVEPTSLAMDSSESSKIESGLVAGFFKDKLPGMTRPEICLQSCQSIRLQQERESEALKTDNTSTFYLTIQRCAESPK